MPVGAALAAMFGASNLLGDDDLPTLIEKVTFSGADNATSGTLALTGYHTVEVFIHVTVGTDDDNNLIFRISDDDGVSWSSTDYYTWSEFGESGGTGNTLRQGDSAAGMFLGSSTSTWGVGNATSESAFFHIYIGDPGGANHKLMRYDGTYVNADGKGTAVWGGASRRITGDVDKMSLLSTDSTTIAGTMYIYGWPTS